MKFEELKIKNEIVKAVTDNGYTTLTPIQEGIIDKVLEGSDVLAQAPTGTGKTAAFAIPMINKIDVNGGIQCIILCPTRELVNQIFAEVKKIGKYIQGFNAVEILGGVPVQSQVRLLKMLPQVVISSPGRMLDHIKNKNINLNNISTIILDEVDEMFNMGMRKDVTNIISSIPSKHQTILISATLSSDVTDASRKFQHEPFVYKVSTDDKQTTSTIKQYFIRVNRNQKVSLIKKLIDENGYKLVVVFSNMKHTAKRLADSLKAVGLKAEAIHSNLKQNARKRVMDEFRAGKHQVLIATDIIARGIDVKNIDAVINFETPQSAESYVHRIGRTGRAGEAGTSYLFLDDNNDWFVKKLAATTKSNIEELKVDGLEVDKQSPTREFTERPRREEDSSSDRMFINVGTKDGFDADSLKDYIFGHTSITSMDISDVYLKDTFGFITIKKEKSAELQTIKEINGREIRINMSEPRKPQTGGRFGGGGRSFGGGRPSYGGGERRSFGGGGRSSFGGGGSSSRPHSFGPRKPFGDRDRNSSRPHGFGQKRSFGGGERNSSRPHGFGGQRKSWGGGNNDKGSSEN